MLHSSIKLVGVLAVVLIASSCAVSEERSGPGADGIPDVVVACIEDRPECQDTISTGDVPTGGNTPLGPSTEPEPNGMVVDQGLSVSEAIAYDGLQPVAVHGFVVRTPDAAELCETLAESYPPQCGGASLTLANPVETDGLPLVEDGDVQWSPDIVTLIGTVAGSELTIDISSI
jgi:hypothetical protein